MRRLVWAVVLLLGVASAALGCLLWMGWRDVPEPASEAFRADVSAVVAAQVSRGAYLARLGNCAACHTARGGQPYAGGRPIETPFGRVYSSNLTPDPVTGLGAWSAEDFRRAMRHGRSRDGRLLNPAFPYLEFSRVSSGDLDALWAFLKTIPSVVGENRANELSWPYRTQWALAVWRGLYFRPEVWRDQPDRSADWNRGGYLVRGLGHCGACHTPRDALGGYRVGLDLQGHHMAPQGWYAPSLRDLAEAGVESAHVDDWVAVLKVGRQASAVVNGPMAEVVAQSTQYFSLDDLRAMASYLAVPSKASGPSGVRHVESSTPGSGERVRAGGQIYERHCSSCHGERGEGVAGAYPALAGNRAVLMGDTGNLVRVVLGGGYGPSTESHPRPHGMPPFRLVLRDDEVAAVLSYVRQAWGNSAAPLEPLDVIREGRTLAP